MIHLPLRPKPYPDYDVMGVRVGKALAWVSLTSTVAFLPIEHQPSISNGRNRWPLVYVKVHPAVVLAVCPACKAKPGQLCTGRDGSRTVTCHVDRKDQFYTDQKTRRA